MNMANGSGEAPFEGKLAGAFGSTNYDWCITDKTYEKMGLSGKSISTIWVDCRPQDCKDVESGLQTLLDKKQHYQFSTYQGTLKTSESTLGMFETLAYGFLLLVGLIAFMNMANTMIISIVTRKTGTGCDAGIRNDKQSDEQVCSEAKGFSSPRAVSLFRSLSGCRLVMRSSATEGSRILRARRLPCPRWWKLWQWSLFWRHYRFSLSFILSRNIKKESIVERIRYQE